MKSLILLSAMTVGAVGATVTPTKVADDGTFKPVLPTIASGLQMEAFLGAKLNKGLTATTLEAYKTALYDVAGVTAEEKAKVTVELPDEKVILYMFHNVSGSEAIYAKVRDNINTEVTASGEKYKPSEVNSGTVNPPLDGEVEQAHMVLLEYPAAISDPGTLALLTDVQKRVADSSVTSDLDLSRSVVTASNAQALVLFIRNNKKISAALDAVQIYEDASAEVDGKTFKFTVTRKNVFGGFHVDWSTSAYQVEEDLRKKVKEDGGFTDLEVLQIGVEIRDRHGWVWIPEGPKQDAMTASVKKVLEEKTFDGVVGLDIKSVNVDALPAPELAASEESDGSGSILIIIIIVVVLLIIGGVAGGVGYFMMNKRNKESVTVAPAAAETA